MLDQSGKMRLAQVNKPQKLTPCSFERIYFSRGSDRDIYIERKRLGQSLVPKILQAVDYDMERTVFSFIPNTAEVAFYGMLEGLDNYLNQTKYSKLKLSEKIPDAANWNASCRCA